MTIEERFERIEHFTAGLAEERRRDREEYRQLWRDTQRQLNDAGVKLNDVAVKINDVAVKIADTNDAIARMGDELRAADQRLGERIESLVSAMGEFLSKQKRPE